MSEFEKLAKEILDQLHFYRDLGVRLTAKTNGTAAAAAGTAFPRPAAVAGRTSLFDGQATVPEDLQGIRSDLGDCRRCKLARTRTHIVFGDGDPQADLMFVGEAPGADEDAQGLPFVGRAGQLLTKIIEAIEMRRDEVYICNILKCRPPGNRNPEMDEISACQPFLFRQIAAVRPRVICALGTFGAQVLLRTREPISRLRGHFIDFHGAKFIATFHPAYLLRNPAEKRKVWEDVQKIRDYLRSFQT
jgi:uracil-DNA glycosylase family 4